MDILNEINSDPKSLSPLVLAYIGDAVFELMVRGYVLKDGNAPVNKLNKKSRNIVNSARDTQCTRKQSSHEIVRLGYARKRKIC